MRVTSLFLGSLLAATVVVLGGWVGMFGGGMGPLQFAVVVLLVVGLLAVLTHGLPSARFCGYCLLAAALVIPAWWGIHGPVLRQAPQVVAMGIVLVGLAGVVATRRGRPGEYEPLALLSGVLLLAALAASRARIEEPGSWEELARRVYERPAPQQWESLRLGMGLYAASCVVGLLGLARIVTSGWKQKGTYLCLYGGVFAPLHAWIVLWGVGGPNVGPVDHVARAGMMLAGPFVLTFAVLSGALACLAAGLLVRTAGARWPAAGRLAWPLALVGWLILLAVQLPKVVGVDFGWRSGAPEMPVSTTGVRELDTREQAVFLRVLAEDRLAWGYDIFELGAYDGRDRAESRGWVMESYREDQRWWDEELLPNGIGVTAGATAPFEWIADELQWIRDALGVERARLIVQLPESHGGWRVWLAGYPTRWSRPAYLSVLLEPPADGADCARLSPEPGSTYAKLVTEIDALRAAGNERVVLELD